MRKSKVWFWTLCCLLSASVARGYDGKTDRADTPAAADYRAILGDYSIARQAYSHAMQTARTDEERNEARKLSPNADDFASRFLELAQKNADDPAALEALIWIVSNVHQGKALKAAVGIVIERHLESEKLTAITQNRGSVSKHRDRLLEVLHRESPVDEVRRSACLELANVLTMKATIKWAVDETPERFAKSYGEEFVAELKEADPDKLKEQAEALYARAIREFGDLDTLLAVFDASGGSGQVAALDRLLEDHAQEQRFLSSARFVATRGNFATPSIESTLKRLAGAGLGRDMDGVVTLSLALIYKSRAESASLMKFASPERLAHFKIRYGSDYFEQLKDADSESLLVEAEGLYAKVADLYADLSGDVVLNGRTFPRPPLGKQAESALFEIRHLSVGKVALEVEGRDLDGVEFKLTDYRGKVVLISFWGHW